MAGLLSQNTSFRITVEGEWNELAVANLIAILRLHKDIMEGKRIEEPACPDQTQVGE